MNHIPDQIQYTASYTPPQLQTVTVYPTDTYKLTMSKDQISRNIRQFNYTL